MVFKKTSYKYIKKPLMIRSIMIKKFGTKSVLFF